MAGIQAGINQILTQAGVMAHLNPELRANAEKRSQLKELSNRENVLREKFKTVRNKEKLKEKSYLASQDIFDKSKDLKEAEVAKSVEDWAYSELEENRNMQSEMHKEYADIAKQIFDIDPTEKNLSKYLTAHKRNKVEGIFSSYRTDVRNERIKTRDEIMKKLASKGQDQVKQRGERKKLVKDLEVKADNSPQYNSFIKGGFVDYGKYE